MDHLSQPRHSPQARLADAWRGSMSTVEECLYWLRLARQGLARTDVAYRTREYLSALKRVSLYQEEMSAQGIQFEKEPNAWKL